MHICQPHLIQRQPCDGSNNCWLGIASQPEEE